MFPRFAARLAEAGEPVKHLGGASDGRATRISREASNARKLGIIVVDPTEAMERIRDNAPREKRPAFTVDEVRAIVRAAPSDEWRGLIPVAAFTGLRLSDAAGLAWGMRDLASGVIRIDTAKTGARRARQTTRRMHRRSPPSPPPECR